MEIWKPVTTMNEGSVPPAGVIPLWAPKLGKEFHRYIGRLPRDQQVRLEVETHRILSACVDPSKAKVDPRTNAGLVLGYVQSGKTANFTGVIAKAADAGYRLVIVLAGTLDILREQTQRRIDKAIALRKKQQHTADCRRHTKLQRQRLAAAPY